MKTSHVAYALVAVVAAVVAMFVVTPMVSSVANAFTQVDSGFHLINGKLTEAQQH